MNTSDLFNPDVSVQEIKASLIHISVEYVSDVESYDDIWYGYNVFFDGNKVAFFDDSVNEHDDYSVEWKSLPKDVRDEIRGNIKGDIDGIDNNLLLNNGFIYDKFTIEEPRLADKVKKYNIDHMKEIIEDDETEIVSKPWRDVTLFEVFEGQEERTYDKKFPLKDFEEYYDLEEHIKELMDLKYYDRGPFAFKYFEGKEFLLGRY